MMQKLKQRWHKRLLEHRNNGLWRVQRTISRRCGTTATCNQQSVINFASNDYLGLGTNTSVIQQFTQAANVYGVGSGASPLVSGYSHAQAQCEDKLSAFFNVDKACIFSSGYLSNLGIFTTLFDADTRVYCDRHVHASIIDACRLAGVRIRRFKHNDVHDCARKLEQDHAIETTKVIVTEGVFSAQGDIAPLPELHQLARRYDCLLMVDDTHGIGVLGEQGKGTLAHYHLPTHAADIVVGTFGKALGGSGGFVLCEALIYDMLTQMARTLMFNTALPAAVFAAMSESLHLIKNEPARQQQLHANITHFQRQAAHYGIHCPQRPAAIQIIPTNNENKASTLAQACLDHQLLVGVLRYPSVPKHHACLRISLSAMHSRHDINRLIHCLNALQSNNYANIA